MAGSYPDAPSRRMAWDDDGSIAHYRRTDDSDVAKEWTPATRVLANEESNAQAAIGGSPAGANVWVVAVIFPQLRELDGIFTAVSEAAVYPTTLHSSDDTTNGIDGTWTQRVADLDNYTITPINYRDNITSLAVATEKSLRISYGGTSNGSKIRALHIYGLISPGETPDRILFLDTDAADAVFTKVLDFGDVPRGQTQTRTIKLKNNSGSSTINTIQITAEDLYLNAATWYTFGNDGISWQATYSVGNLGPGATETIHLKQIVPDAETLGLQTGRIKVSHDMPLT